MKKILSILIFSVAILLWGVCLFNVNAVSATTTTIKFQSAYPQSSVVTPNLKLFVKNVEKYTNGEVKIKLFWPGQLVETKEAFNALQRGMIGGLSCSMVAFVGIVPEAGGEWLPYAWENSSDFVDIYLNRGYLDLMREALAKHGIYYLAPLSGGANGLITKFPVHKLEDLAGKKIRALGLIGETVRLLGAAPVSLPATEQYMALQRGTVDGVDFSLYTIEAYKFYEVVDYVITPPIFTPGLLSIQLSAKVWDTLSPKNKEAINRAAEQALMQAALYAEVNDRRVDKFCKEKGINIIEFPPEEIKRFREAVFPVYESHAKKSDLCARQVEIIQKYWNEKGR